MNNKINEIIAAVFKIGIDKAAENHTMDTIANWDSLTHMDLIVSIEDTLGIQLSGDDIAEMISFDAIRQLVGKYI